MSKRAEKRALELFPVDMQMCIDGTGETHEADVNAQRRKYVAFGYEQAEKDTIERACEWLGSLDDGDRIVDVKALVSAFRNEMEE